MSSFLRRQESLCNSEAGHLVGYLLAAKRLYGQSAEPVRFLPSQE